LLASLRGLVPVVRRLGELIEELKKILTRLNGRGNGGGTYPRLHGGHTSRPRSPIDFERQERWAGEAYDNIRDNPDAEVIARNGGLTEAEAEQVRQHIFFEEHPLRDDEGGIAHGRYDASPDMAEAWLRLRSGRQLPEDMALLEHELAESNYYRDHPGATYEQAHTAANQVSNWQNRVPEPTYEDYSEPWR
jgi:hypothetical protein